MSTSKPAPGASESARESAHQIWLAGLGAFNKAQAEGGKVFDALVQEGLSMQRKAQATAQAKFDEAGERMNRMAEEITQRASGQWDRIESLFEDRVARALERLGIPAASDVKALKARVADLEARLAAHAPAAKKAAPAKKPAAKKTAAKKTAPAKTARKKR